MTISCLNRRHFLHLSALGVAGGCLARHTFAWAADPIGGWDPTRPLLDSAKSLRVQPVLMYRLPVRQEQTSWKSWGGVQTEDAVCEEITRIEKELSDLRLECEFKVQFNPVLKVQTPDDAARVHESEHDAVLVYACTGGGDLLRACFSPGKDTLIFVRHRSGPVYYWYEALSVKYLETRDDLSDASLVPQRHRPHVEDVVVDDYRELLWRLRALAACKSLRSSRVIALGGVWGKYSPDAPKIAREQFGLTPIEVSYEEFGPRLRRAQQDQQLMERAREWMERYLGLSETTLRTERPFVQNAFLLYYLFKELMQEHQAEVFTIKSCMGTIIPQAKTTACLSLSLLNDEGHLAFCESDFVVIPAGILLRYLARKPVFLHNSTFPHQGRVTCAHCTAPRRMDGQRYEPAILVTHYESEYGAAPKVTIPPGQPVCFINPEYSAGRWVGFRGVVRDNPFLEICRSQQEVEIMGNWRQLLKEVRDSHWLMVYGDYLKEAGYAARKLGLRWDNLSA